MSSAMTSLEELVAAFRAGRMKLPVLFDSLGERGAVPDEQYARDVAWLEHLRDHEGFDPQIVRALLAKLASLQPQPANESFGSETPGDEDATRVQVPSSAAHAAADDATRVMPAAASEAAGSDGTLVRPQAGGDDAATLVQPASRPGTTAATGSTSSSLNASTWQRVAGESGGEYATVGMLLKGRFLLERELGRGGMGVVYLARDERKVEARDRDPYVAVKVLNDEFRRHPDSLIALQREARRSQQLAHDNIVRVYDFDKDGTIVFMTMEYIDGTSLKTLIRERAYNGMPLAEARPLIEGMAWALNRAHAAGVVHSDFKPGNVMVTRDGMPKVFDFGIARAGKHFGAAAGEQTVFDAGTLGALTPAYASLEMLRGAEPTPSDDIYALGCVVYELLTGKHPFDKVSAEVALKEGRKSPHVSGLTQRQNQALRKAVAFHHEQRLRGVLELVEGLRHVGWRERARPLMIYGVIALVVLALAGWGVDRYMAARHLASVVDRFDLGNPRHYVNEDQAYQSLQGLGENASKRVVIDHGSAIESFLLSRLNAYWDPAHKRYDYAGVQHVFQIRDRLKLFSPQLDIKRSEIQQQRNVLLNTLDTQLSQRIAAGKIFQTPSDDAVDTLDAIRAVDPNSELLDNAELQLKYDIAIGQSLDARRIDEAKRRLALATRLFPHSSRLQQRAAQLATIESANAAAVKVMAHEQSVPEARAALANLIAKPALTPEWQAAVNAALEVLHADHAPATQKLINALADAIAAEAATATQPPQVQRASSMVALGLAYAPVSRKLIAQRARLAALQQQAQAKLAQESADAEVASRIESMKRAAAAHDIAKATDSLNRIRALQPNNDFLASQGPQLLAQAYLGQADSLMGRGEYQRAADMLGRSLDAVGNRSDLRNARARDAFVAALMKARKHPPDAAGIQRLRKQLASLRKTDVSGVDALESDLKLHGELPQGSSLADLVEGLRPGNAVTSAAPSAPIAAAQPSSAAPASVPGITAQTDPCARTSLVGRGRMCSDGLGSARGPALVVVPGIGGGKPYAMSRTEVTLGEFNRFCKATHQCAAKGGSADLPVSNVSLAEAKAYAAWLTKMSGYAYRLPTDAEWMHAAAAGQGWAQAPDSNCIPPSAGGDSGPGGPISARGREPNPWGLVNLTGNVWEWVIDGSGVMVRGGSYNSYWSDCTVASHRSDSGKPQGDVGFRVLRELK